MEKTNVTKDHQDISSSQKPLDGKEVPAEEFERKEELRKDIKKRNVRLLGLCGSFLLVAITVFVCIKLFSHDKQTIDYKLIPVLSGEKWGYIDHKGRFVVNPQFNDCSLFSEGLALVKSSNDRVGYINSKGAFVIEPKYKTGTDFSEGLAFVVREDGYPECIDKTGEVIFTLKDAKSVRGFCEGRACYMASNLKCGFVDKTGKVVISPQFEAASDFHEGLALVFNKDNKAGYIDKSGKLVIMYQFDKAGAFSEGLAPFSNGEMIGFISPKGKYIINPQFDDASSFSDGLSAIEQGDMYGFIDKKGKIVINPQFEDVEPFSEGLAVVGNGEKYGYINKEGKYEINPQFDLALPFSDGVAGVCSAGKWGLINKKGEYIVNPQFSGLMEPEKQSWSVNSEYYDAKPFVNAFLNNASKNTFDGFTNKGTLKDIVEHEKYGSTADTRGMKTVVWEEGSYITDDVWLKNVEFFFKDDVYDYDYNHFDYDSYSYEKEYKLSAPFQYITYTFEFKGETASRYSTIFRALKSKLSEIYGVTFTDSDDFSYGQGDQFSFIIDYYYGMISLYVFMDKSFYQFALNNRLRLD